MLHLTDIGKVVMLITFIDERYDVISIAQDGGHSVANILPFSGMVTFLLIIKLASRVCVLIKSRDVTVTVI